MGQYVVIYGDNRTPTLLKVYMLLWLSILLNVLVGRPFIEVVLPIGLSLFIFIILHMIAARRNVYLYDTHMDLRYLFKTFHVNYKDIYRIRYNQTWREWGGLHIIIEGVDGKCLMCIDSSIVGDYSDQRDFIQRLLAHRLPDTKVQLDEHVEQLLSLTEDGLQDDLLATLNTYHVLWVNRSMRLLRGIVIVIVSLLMTITSIFLLLSLF